MSEWQLIETAPRDGTEVIVGFDIATVWIVRNARWSEGSRWKEIGHESQGEARGWWSPKHSVTQVKLEGIYEPTHWIPLPTPPGEAA